MSNCRLNQRLALINTANQNFHSRLTKELQSVQRISKAYLPLLKSFLNDTNKPMILPLYHKDEFLTSFNEEVNLPLIRFS